MVLIYASIVRKAAREGSSLASTEVFVAGYLIAWSLFALVATIAQWALDRMPALADDDEQQHYSRWTALTSRGGLPANTVQRRLSATLSLSNSVPRLPLETRGVGAFQMGIEHGSFCLGCCWVLMALLFFGGVMNLWWIGGLTLLVLLEKILPFGALAGRMIGAIVAILTLYRAPA